MILCHEHIKTAFESGAWTAYRDGAEIEAGGLHINSNSIDVTLGRKFLWIDMGSVVDFHKPDCLPWQDTPLSSEDTIGMFPNDFYLAHTAERFDCSAPLEINGRETYFIPMLEGRSTVARCGLSVHSSAGYGDVGFSSSWTLELTTALPIILRPGDRIAQVFFIEASSGTVKYDGAYTDQHDGPRAPVLGKERFR